MENTYGNSVWSELWNSIKYYIESKRGKYSLDTYLDIVEKYTDIQIIEEEKNGLVYLGGECEILNLSDTDTYNFFVRMYFENNSGEKIVKEAKRNLPKDKFVSEMAKDVGEKVKFEIQRQNKGGDI